MYPLQRSSKSIPVAILEHIEDNGRHYRGDLRTDVDTLLATPTQRAPALPRFREAWFAMMQIIAALTDMSVLELYSSGHIAEVRTVLNPP